MEKFKNYCDKYNYAFDDNMTEFTRIFNNKKFKELHTEVYFDDSDLLVVRSEENNVDVLLNNDKAIIYKKNKAIVVNISLKSIDKCITKQYNSRQYEVIFLVHNLYYKMFIVL